MRSYIGSLQRGEEREVQKRDNQEAVCSKRGERERGAEEERR